jgi:hypothetical protein
LQVESLVEQIQNYDPGFRYATIAPIGYTYTNQDIETLENILQQYQSQTSCTKDGRINYGETPAGRPFTRHYGAETGPVRNLPPSLLDAILDGTVGAPGASGTTVHYDADNNVTVVTGTNGIVSAHVGPPRASDSK